jgi:hypothetical protein
VRFLRKQAVYWEDVARRWEAELTCTTNQVELLSEVLYANVILSRGAAAD